MAINASIDGVSYNDITKIVTGGKNILLSYIDSGGDLPECIAEIAYGTYTQATDTGATKTFTHGCAAKPDIIILWSDFLTRYTSESPASGSTIVGVVWNNAGGFKAYTTVSAGYSGETYSTAPYAATLGSTDDGHITNVGDSTFDILFKSNRRCGGGLKYEWLSIRLQGVS